MLGVSCRETSGGAGVVGGGEFAVMGRSATAFRLGILARWGLPLWAAQPPLFPAWRSLPDVFHFWTSHRCLSLSAPPGCPITRLSVSRLPYSLWLVMPCRLVVRRRSGARCIWVLRRSRFRFVSILDDAAWWALGWSILRLASLLRCFVRPSRVIRSESFTPLGASD